MSRYTKDIPLNKPEDFVNFILNDFIQKNEFKPYQWKNQESCYRSGDKMVEGYRYFKWSYLNGVLHVEAWRKGAFGNEVNLNGFIAMIPKKQYKKNLQDLFHVLNQPLPEDAFHSDGKISDLRPIEVQTVDQSSHATRGLIFGILSIPLCLIPICGVLLGCLSFPATRLGMSSSKRNLAVAGRVCGIIGICLSAALWILNIIGASINLVQLF